MSDVFVDGARRALGNTPNTWGELLGTLDADLGGRGVLLAAVRFDGVEEPAFREPSVTARALTTVQRVDVETATPDALLRQWLTVADVLEYDIEPILRAWRTRLEELTHESQGRSS